MHCLTHSYLRPDDGQADPHPPVASELWQVLQVQRHPAEWGPHACRAAALPGLGQYNAPGEATGMGQGSNLKP